MSVGTDPPSDDNHMYDRQAGGTHPTGMLSCFVMRFLRVKGDLMAHTYEFGCPLFVLKDTAVQNSCAKNNKNFQLKAKCLNKIGQVWVGVWR